MPTPSASATGISSLIPQSVFPERRADNPALDKFRLAANSACVTRRRAISARTFSLTKSDRVILVVICANGVAFMQISITSDVKTIYRMLEIVAKVQKI